MNRIEQFDMTTGNYSVNILQNGQNLLSKQSSYVDHGVSSVNNLFAQCTIDFNAYI
jgi:hypothetical protein